MSTLARKYIPTKKNGLVAKHYEKLGFTQTDADDDGTTTWELDVASCEASDAPIERKADG